MFVIRSIRELFRRVPAPVTARQSPPRGGLAVSLLLTVFVAVRLGVAQPIEPREVPFPRLDQALLAQQSAEQQRLLNEAVAGGLPLEVRAVGELVRRLGQAEASASTELGALRRRLERQARSVLGNHVDAMLRLRALQAHMFAEELSRWTGEPPPSAELVALGGTFPNRIAPLLKRGTRLPAAELAAAFRVRWTELTRLDQHVRFAPTANDLRLSARLRLRWAETLNGSERGALQLQTVQLLGELDAEYPKAFASGVAHYHAREYRAAFDQFALHLKQRPNGPWTLRAQNHATAAAARLLGAN